MGLCLLALVLVACADRPALEGEPDVPAGPVPDVLTDGAEATDGDAQQSPDVPPPGPETSGDLGADGEIAPETVPVPVPDLDQLLTLHHIQMKGTHNSYHVEPLLAPLDGSWSYTHAPLDVQLGDLGVRQVELDIHDPTGTDFAVYHVPLVDDVSTCPTLTACLGIIKAWSDAHPTHHTIFICIEPKDLGWEKIQDPGNVDEVILSVFPREQIVAPDDVRGEHPDLRTALETDGWPTLGETRGKVLFLALDEGAFRDGYLDGHPLLEERVMFARGGIGEGWGAIVETGNTAEVALALADGYLVRSHTDSPQAGDEDNEIKSQTALGSGAHLLSSDIVEPMDGGYSFQVPGGTPSRCNPVTAPPECVSAAIENL